MQNAQDIQALKTQEQNPCPPGRKFVGMDEKTGLPWCQDPFPPWVGQIGAFLEKNIVTVALLAVGLVVLLLGGGGRRR
ncbi:MAG: hypothetical protein RML48_04875 [Candidatus Bipolaricaulota bacterium]|nr:hypothetical protein [Candidatus Bipolaricaulota bacterium]